LTAIRGPPAARLGAHREIVPRTLLSGQGTGVPARGARRRPAMVPRVSEAGAETDARLRAGREPRLAPEEE